MPRPSRPLKPQELDRILADADAEAARRSFYTFVQQGWSIVEPSDSFQPNWHVDAICEHLEAVAKGQIRKLVINIPPGFAKSLLTAVFWPAWMWTHRPDWKGLFSSYAQDLAVRDAVKARTLMDSDWYQNSFLVGRGVAGNKLWKFSDDMNRKDMYTNTATGFRLSLSVGSKATGFRGNAVVADDPLNAKEYNSKPAREEAIFWWDKVMSSRVNRPEEDARVIMMQRLHEDDPTGHVLRAGGYECLMLPAEFDSRRRSVTFTRTLSIVEEEVEEAVFTSGAAWHQKASVQEAVKRLTKIRKVVVGEPKHFFSDPRTIDGELLFPARFPKKYLDEQRRTLGSDGYAGQYLQNPTPPEGGMFKYAWWRFWRHPGATDGYVGRTPISLDPEKYARPRDCYQGEAKVIPHIRHIVGSLDAAFKGTEESDYVVFGVWGIIGFERYLLDVVRGKMDFVATKRELLRLVAKWPMCMKWLIEEAANGAAVISDLQGQVPGMLPLKPEGGKESRAAANTPQIEAGQVFLPDGAPWVQAFVDEHASFPKGRNDDQVDMTSQVLTHLATSREAARAALLFSV